jgi:hypothetical protein
MSGEREEYLGDAVYASFDGWNIWLRTGDGNDQRIALEPEVQEAFIRYRDRLYQSFRQAVLKVQVVCEDCPPVDYPTDKTRCAECPRRSSGTEVKP